MNKNDKEKKIRSSKTISEKYEIIMHYEKLVKENKVQYPKAETVKHFKLKQTSSLNTILAKSCEIKKSFVENQASETRMRFKNSKYADIDDELYSYFLKMREKKAQINTNDLKSKALEIGVGKGYDRFNAINGFIRCFKNIHNIHFTELYGDAGGVDPAVCSNWFKKISTLIENYEDKNIYNIDETGLYYQAESGKTYISGAEYANKDLRGTKKSKQRLTVLVGASLSGEKLPLLVIGKSAKPRCLANVSSYPTMYRSQPSAWMDSNLFIEYLNRLDRKYFVEQRKCVFFIDNCRAHPPIEHLNHLQSIQVIFFPPNVTSMCQPMDMGIIANLKVNYKNYLSKSKNLHLENDQVFNVNVLDAMYFLKKSWEDVKPSTIQHCFNKAQFIRKTVVVQIADVPNDVVPNENEIEDLLDDVGPSESEIEDLLDQVTRFDDDFLPTCDSNGLLNSQMDSLAEEPHEETEEEIRILKSSEVLQHLAELSKFLLLNGIDSNTVYDFKSVAYDAIASCKKQSLITDYLIKN
jgi:hypothetical protein